MIKHKMPIIHYLLKIFNAITHNVYLLSGVCTFQGRAISAANWTLYYETLKSPETSIISRF